MIHVYFMSVLRVVLIDTVSLISYPSPDSYHTVRYSAQYLAYGDSPLLGNSGCKNAV